MKPDKTSTLLIEHLEQKDKTLCRELLILAAKNMHYDDFGSELATPKMQLYQDLHDAGYTDLATNVTQGIYD